MNDYERKQAEELAAKKYPNPGKPGERALARRAYIEGYGDALESVAPTEEADITPGSEEDLITREDYS